ncbi:GAF domain-containing protein [Arthrobacter sp. GAS37]|uniref:GAF domain-containing protein n=1 Tax=Arthrobacter sp. GAS37 TaxID=3156261 RepID=UPI00384DC855
MIAALGAAALPLSVTDRNGLVYWIRWITDPFWFWAGLVGIVLGTLWAIAGGFARSSEVARLRTALAASKAHTTKRIFNQLSPVIHDMGKLAESQSATYGRDLVNRALDLVTRVIEVPDARACLYYLDQVESTQASSDDVLNALTLRTPHVGRFDAPRGNFVRNESPEADGVFAVIDGGSPRLIENIETTDYAVDCSGKGYRTFLNVPVKFQTAEIGVLSVDAPHANSLTTSHVLLAEVVAQFLAVGLRREKKKKQERYPSPSSAIESRAPEGSQDAGKL